MFSPPFSTSPSARALSPLSLIFLLTLFWFWLRPQLLSLYQRRMSLIPTCLNNYRPVTLTPIIMKCFERVMLAHIQRTIPDTEDPLQFAYQSNRLTSDAIVAVFHFSFSHLETRLLHQDALCRLQFRFQHGHSLKFTHILSIYGVQPTLCD